ncbi:uncharacterized protein FIBRA_09071 [Fibroporia radiculosa]|uniref:Uncharacterized protein n=1 Tax=Fibroporia radiculosa TaxID=599839 RepID=J4GIU1_9APHY|nr:uncharacterized protein FIBRA_09071 [Fibroporia radiculosa]CCM06773.1 predicted protein [Fibroporia radiculosa]
MNPDALLDSGVVNVAGGTHECKYLGLRAHRMSFPKLGLALEPYLLIRQEYVDAWQYLVGEFQPDLAVKDLRGVSIIGQPGIGKSFLLVYLFIERMKAGLPAAFQLRDPHSFLIDEHSVTASSSVNSTCLNEYPHIWCLSDSNTYTTIPASAFFDGTFHVIQAASPLEARWRGWTKGYLAMKYYMNVWERNEPAALARCLWGQHAVRDFLDLASKWGPSPRDLVRASTDPSVEDIVLASIERAAQTFDGVYGIQPALSSEHSSAEKGLVRLESELPAEHRRREKTRFVIIGHGSWERGYAAAKDQRRRLLVAWGNVTIGYFIPLRLRGHDIVSSPED